MMKLRFKKMIKYIIIIVRIKISKWIKNQIN